MSEYRRAEWLEKERVEASETQIKRGSAMECRDVRRATERSPKLMSTGYPVRILFSAVGDLETPCLLPDFMAFLDKCRADDQSEKAYSENSETDSGIPTRRRDSGSQMTGFHACCWASCVFGQ